MAIADFEQLRDDLARDDSGTLAAAERDQALSLAVGRYSKDRPRVLVEDVTQATTGAELALPAAWEDEVSDLVSIEYPIGENPPQYITAWRYYRDPNGVTVMTDTAVPADADVRMTFTAAHQLDAGSDTIPAKDREAVACWAAALLLDQLAAYYAGSQDSTLQADAVDYGSKSGDYARRANALRKRYFDELGIDPKRTVPASAVAEMEIPASIGGRRLTQGRRRL